MRLAGGLPMTIANLGEGVGPRIAWLTVRSRLASSVSGLSAGITPVTMPRIRARALVAVADRRPAGAPTSSPTAHGAMAFTDHRDLIGKVDAVSIAVPAASTMPRSPAISSMPASTSSSRSRSRPTAPTRATSIARAERAGRHPPGRPRRALLAGRRANYASGVTDPRRIACVRRTNGRAARPTSTSCST